MPGVDRTGPMGQGPRTGRGLGLCGPGEPARPAEGPAIGLGRGAGRGLGRGGGRRGGGGGQRGWRNWFHATGLTGWQRAAAGAVAESQSANETPESPSSQAVEEEAETLRDRIAALEGELAEMKERLDKAAP